MFSKIKRNPVSSAPWDFLFPRDLSALYLHLADGEQEGQWKSQSAPNYHVDVLKRVAVSM